MHVNSTYRGEWKNSLQMVSGTTTSTSVAELDLLLDRLQVSCTSISNIEYMEVVVLNK